MAKLENDEDLIVRGFVDMYPDVNDDTSLDRYYISVYGDMQLKDKDKYEVVERLRQIITAYVSLKGSITFKREDLESFVNANYAGEKFNCESIWVEAYHCQAKKMTDRLSTKTTRDGFPFYTARIDKNGIKEQNDVHSI